MQQIIEQFSQRIREAGDAGSPLHIQGSGSKAFYGRIAQGSVLDVRPYSGIVSYEATELVLTARAGTPLTEIEAALSAKRQMLPFEPPHFGTGATLGGCIAVGLSGPRRAYAGSARDFVLGVRMLDANGEDLRFGGQVMKNVAGYDISRLMTGSLGTLGLLLEVSLKVLPVPAQELTLRFSLSEAEALDKINRWAAQPLSLSATCYHAGELTVRLSGAIAAVNSVRNKLGGDEVKDADIFWHRVREQQHDFFKSAKTLWRLSLPSTATAITLPGQQMIEWGGAQRWLASEASADTIRQVIDAMGGHATLFRSATPVDHPFQPLSAPLMEIHKRLKQRFDPHQIFNPGRMYRDL